MTLRKKSNFILAKEKELRKRIGELRNRRRSKVDPVQFYALRSVHQFATEMDNPKYRLLPVTLL